MLFIFRLKLNKIKTKQGKKHKLYITQNKQIQQAANQKIVFLEIE